MSATIDAQVLIEAANTSSARFGAARALLDRLTRADEVFYVFWPVALAFLRVSTHPRLFPAPLELPVALTNLEALLAVPNVRTGAERANFLDLLRSTATSASARRKLIHHAHLVALMREYGVNTIWTNDQDFMRFQGIRVVDPFAPNDP
jgi:toxin-antitoxin system PIN domain toxin